MTTRKKVVVGLIVVQNFVAVKNDCLFTPLWGVLEVKMG